MRSHADIRSQSTTAIWQSEITSIWPILLKNNLSLEHEKREVVSQRGAPWGNIFENLQPEVLNMQHI